MDEKLALFDLDGTLVNTSVVNYFAYKSALEKYGCNLDFEYFSSECNGQYYKTFIPEIIKQIYLDCNEDQINMMVEDIHNQKIVNYSHYISKAEINWQLIDLLDAIRPIYKTALVTTASYNNCYELLNHFQLRDKFDLIITNRDVKQPKPAPEGFIKAMKYFNVKPENTIIFEDSNAGISAAEAAGGGVFVVKGYR